MATTDPIRTLDELHALSDYFIQRKEYRNNVLVVLGISTTLPINKLLELRWSDVYDKQTGKYKDYLILGNKSGKTRAIPLSKEVIKALSLYRPICRSIFLFPSRSGSQPISRIQAWRIIKKAATALNLNGEISCLSLRKTWGYHAWTSKAASPDEIMMVYRQENIENTMKFLRVAPNDSDEVLRKVNLF